MLRWRDWGWGFGTMVLLILVSFVVLRIGAAQIVGWDGKAELSHWVLMVERFVDGFSFGIYILPAALWKSSQKKEQTPWQLAQLYIAGAVVCIFGVLSLAEWTFPFVFSQSEFDLRLFFEWWYLVWLVVVAFSVWGIAIWRGWWADRDSVDEFRVGEAVL